jgi:hypothetical protein
VRKLIQLGLGVPLLAAGYAFFFVPYLAVVAVDRAMHVERDVRSTIKFFAGFFFYPPWIALLTTLTWWRFGWGWGTTALVGLPVLGIATQLMRERWGAATLAVRRYLALRKSSLRMKLRGRRAEIARELDELRKRDFA